MRIAVNTRFLQRTRMEGFGWYTYEVVKRMVESHPEHHFIFFFDRKFDSSFVFGSNVEPVILYPQARHPILQLIWFEISVKRALKKYRADVFFSPDGYLSLGAKLPQVIVMHDINFEHYPRDLPWFARNFLRRFFPKYASKASAILTVSDFSKQDISTTYRIPPYKIRSVWNGVSDIFKPLDSETISDIRAKLSGGHPYFIFVGAIHPRKNTDRLIAAFAEYCNKPNTDYRLVIVGAALWGEWPAVNKLADEVKKRIIFTGHLSRAELAGVLAAASVLTFVPYFEGFGIPMAEAMKCGVPILAGNKSVLPEVAGEAAVYVDPMSVNSIAEGMLTIAGDEGLRMDLAQKALNRAPLFDWNKSAEVAYEVIRQAASTNA